MVGKNGLCSSGIGLGYVVVQYLFKVKVKDTINLLESAVSMIARLTMSSRKKFLCYSAEFPKLSVHWYPLDTLTGLHVPQNLLRFSKKKRPSARISLGFYEFRVEIKVISKKKRSSTNQTQQTYKFMSISFHFKILF